jgi:hypothetical protein
MHRLRRIGELAYAGQAINWEGESRALYFQERSCDRPPPRLVHETERAGSFSVACPSRTW